jgi:hypothetical protein
VFPTPEDIWLGATSALELMDADDPETQIVAGRVRGHSGRGHAARRRRRSIRWAHLDAGDRRGVSEVERSQPASVDDA